MPQNAPHYTAYGLLLCAVGYLWWDKKNDKAEIQRLQERVLQLENKVFAAKEKTIEILREGKSP